MTMTVVVEEEETEDVGCEAKAAHDEDELGVGDFLRFDKSLDGFEEDGETECDEEDAIDQGTEGLGSLPLEVVSTSCKRSWGLCCSPHKCTSSNLSFRLRP